MIPRRLRHPAPGSGGAELSHRPSWLACALGVLACLGPAVVPPSACAAANAPPCGELLALSTGDDSRTRLALASPTRNAAGEAITLMLLAGGDGHVDLDDRGCPQALLGNSLLRSVGLFLEAGFHTALVDAPSDHQGPDGLAGFRTEARHAQDLGRVVAALRLRNGGQVWMIGTSRGTISAVNAATRLTGPSAPDGIVLTSVLTSGQSGARRAYVAQSVFDLPLASIRMPVLAIGHAADTCVRSPPARTHDVVGRTASTRRQAVIVNGGPGATRATGIAACEGRSPHGFVEQEAEVAAGIARFVRGGSY